MTENEPQMFKEKEIQIEGKSKKETEKEKASNEQKEILENMKIENDRREEIISREEEMRERKLNAGEAEAGIQPVKPIPLSDKEYAEKVKAGEVNPLKDDGIF